jgi:phosphohistidine phosphatase
LKTVFIIRHAKSDQSFFGNDFERPLNERGKNDAPMMAKRLKHKQPVIDAFISSPAKRAKKTAELFAKEYGKKEHEVIFISALYHAPAPVFYEVISTLSGDLNAIALFAHNPGITSFINSLIDDASIDNMPTCGVFSIKTNIKSWDEFASAKKEFVFFDYPKL